ncbi:hypothetical protein [Pelagibius sp.]|uniref:hypothetical protein n=1 Tax=Pelagibius sp. TaxID=1931238 RepID=UPI00262C1052|nr:hypothetical protein [Pelagibius sp.]
MAISLGKSLKFSILGKDKSAAAMNSVKRGLSGLKSAMGAVMTATRAVATAGAALVAGFVALIAKTEAATDRIGKLSTRLGASTEALSQYEFVAKRSNVAFEALTQGWQRMTRRISEAANGTGEAKDALRELGLSATDLERLRPEEQFEVLADALAGVEGQADRVRLAMKLFDSEGVALLQTMKGGSAAIREMRAEADALGVTITQEMAEAAARSRDQMVRLEAAFRGLTIAVVNALGPALTQLTIWLSEMVPRAVQFLHETLLNMRINILADAQAIVDGIASMLDALAALPEFAGGHFFEEQALALKLFSIELGSMRYEAELALQTFKEGVPAVSEFGQGFEDLAGSVGKVGIEAKDLKRDFDAMLKTRDQYLRGLENEAEAVRRAVETPIEAYNRQIEKLKQLRDEGLITQETFGRATKQAEETLKKEQEALEGVRKEMDLLTEAVRTGDRALSGSMNTLRDWGRLALDIIHKIIQAMVSVPKQGGGGFKLGDIGGIILNLGSSVFSGGSLGPQFTGSNIQAQGSFATGGSFTVGGSGGTDSQTVAFKATPGERVDVLTPGQQRAQAGMGGTTVYIDARGSNGDAAVEEAVRRGIARAAPGLINASVETVRGERQRDPRFFGSQVA